MPEDGDGAAAAEVAELQLVVRMLQSARERRRLDEAILFLREVVGQPIPRLGGRVVTVDVLDQAMERI